MRYTAARIAALITAVGIFVLDRWSKHAIETSLSPDDVRTVIPGFFNLVRSQNRGIAFGIFNTEGGPGHTTVLALFSVVAILILLGMLWKIDRLDRFSAIGVSLIFGGALGNVYDRIAIGAVTDFLDFYVGSYHWYTFNIADSAICVGAGLLLVSAFIAPKPRTASEA